MKNGKTTMTKAAAARIQSAEAKSNGGGVSKGSFASRAQSAAASTSLKNAPSKTGNPSGGNRGNNPPRK